MGWIRVSDDFYDNDKMLAAGTVGRDLYWHGMAFCNRNLTDGLVPRGRALALVDWTHAAILTGTYSGVDGQDCGPIAVELVLTAGLWHEDGHDCPDCVQPGPRHYVIHDYLKYQPSRAEVEAKAEANRERVRKWTDKRKAATNGVTNALATQPLMEQLHDTPNPNPNPIKRGGDAGAEPTNDTTTLPPPICSKHGENNAETPCRPCKRRREWLQEQELAQERDELEYRRQLRDAATNCPTCHGTNWIPDTEPAVKCSHNQKEQHA